MPVSIISRTSKAKYMKKMEKKNLVLEIVWNQPYMFFLLSLFVCLHVYLQVTVPV